ncbi:MAG: hypothetical protein ACRDTD_24350, partial [Pseudonocardiaceae bacterium]
MPTVMDPSRGESTQAAPQHPPLVSLSDGSGAEGVPFPRVFTEMALPLARNFNVLPEFDLRLVSKALGKHPPLRAPALANISVDLVPSLDQEVALPLGTMFATASSYEQTPATFSTLADVVLPSAALLCAGKTLKDSPLSARNFTVLAKDLTVTPQESIVFVLSRPLPQMACLITLPVTASATDWASRLTWQAWQGEAWVPCGSGTDGGRLSEAPQSADFTVPVPAGHSGFDFPSVGEFPGHSGAGLLRCTPGETLT